MRIAVIGTGAMGGLFGARLAMSGQDVTLIDESQATIDAIRQQGLVLHYGHESNALRLPVGRAQDFDGLYDLLIVFTKGFHTAAAIQSAAHLIGPESWVLSAQNGLGNDERIAAVVKREQIMVGMTNFPADLVKPGVVRTQGSGHISIWSASGKDEPGVHRIAAALSDAGLPCRADSDVKVAIWEKLAFNGALNALCAVSGLTVGEVGGSEHGRALASEIIEETVAVAKASGVDAQRDRVAASVEYAFKNHASHKPSMLQDIEARRPTEIDFINGAAADRGRQFGVDTPVLRTVTNLVKLIESKY